MKPMTVVKFDFNGMMEKLHSYKPISFIENYYEVFGDDLWVFLGELTNMKGYGVYANYDTGKIVCGYHIDDFKEYEDE